MFINYNVMADNPLPEFIRGVFDILYAFRVVQIFFFLIITVFKPAVIPVAGVSSLLLFFNTFILVF